MAVDIVENYERWGQTFREGWLKHYRETGEVDWDRYNKPSNKTAPEGRGIDPAEARLLLVSSAGSYLKASQEPYIDDNEGDYSTRRYPFETPFAEIAFAHYHYNHNAVDEDPQVLLPLAHLRDMVNEGIIGEMAAEVVSFNGYQPDVTRVIDQTVPDIIAAAKEMQATAVLLVPS